MFKALSLFQLNPCWTISATAADAAARQAAFVECLPSQALSIGLVPPRGEEEGALVEVFGTNLVLRVMIERRTPPAEVVQRHLDARTKEVEAEIGRRLSAKQLANLRDQVVRDLLPKTFTKREQIYCVFSRALGLLLLETTIAARADEILSLLAKTFQGFSAGTYQTATSPALVMRDWLHSGEPGAGFAIHEECELVRVGPTRGVVRYRHHDLHIAQIREHLRHDGHLPTELGLTWGGLAFVLTSRLALKKIGWPKGLRGEGARADAGEFDALMVLATGELERLIPELVNCCGGRVPDLFDSEEAEMRGDGCT